MYLYNYIYKHTIRVILFMYIIYSGTDDSYASAAVSKREGTETSIKYIYLGRVLDREKGIYKSRERGVFCFDVSSGTFSPVPDDYVPPQKNDGRKLKKVSVDFGDAFFMDSYLHSSGLMQVIDQIKYGNPDTLHAMVLFYTLSGLANCDAVHWFEGNIARLIYPNANLTSQRISDFLAAIGTPEKQMDFQKAYLGFVMEHYDNDKNILIDSSGLLNDIHFPLTCRNVHNGKVSNEIRLIFVVQRSTGIPIYYRAVPGNIVDVSTLRRVFLHLDSLGIDISSCIMDAGYNSGDNLDLFYDENHKCKIGFITRIGADDTTFKTMVSEGLGSLDTKENLIKYEDRYLFIKKKQVMVGSKKENPAWLYLGLDLAMWGNKLEFTAEAYIRDTVGMLTDGMDLPAVYGATVPQMNAADLRTKGYELSISWRDSFNLLGSPFEYFVKPILSEYRSNITKFKNDTKLLSNYYEGMELGEIWGFHVDGLFASDAEAKEYTSRVDQSYCNANLNGGWKAGDLKYADLGGKVTYDDKGNVISNEPDGVIGIGANTLADHGDRIYLGNSLPRLHYGLSTGFAWKGIDVSVFFEGTGDHYWYPARYNFDFWGPFSLGYPTFLAKNFLDKCWSEDNPNAYFPRPRSNVASNGGGELGRVNDRYLQNIRYLRFKNITVGYELPKKLISHVGLEGLRVYFSGENLAYWSPITKVTDHLDPESCFNRGSDPVDDLNNTSYPWQKTFMFGIDITF